MSTTRFYVCTGCQKWIRTETEEVPTACPDCSYPLEHVPVTEAEFNSWSESTRQELAATYAYAKTNPTAAKPAKKKGKGCFAAMLTYLVCALVGIGIFYLIANTENLLHKADFMQREADISLNQIIDRGEELPVNEYVSFEARWVIGPIATQTTTSNMRGSLSATTGVDYYYYCILEDMTVIGLQAAAANDVEALDRMSDWLLDVEGYPMNGETLLMQGQLEKLTDPDLKSIYNEYLTIFELSPNDPEVHYLVLNTTAGRLDWVIYCGAAVIIIFVVVLVRIKKNGKKAA